MNETPKKNNSIKPIEVVEHGNYLYGTLDGLDFVVSGIMQDTKKPYPASLKLKFIMIIIMILILFYLANIIIKRKNKHKRPSIIIYYINL